MSRREAGERLLTAAGGEKNQDDGDQQQLGHTQDQRHGVQGGTAFTGVTCHQQREGVNVRVSLSEDETMAREESLLLLR